MTRQTGPIGTEPVSSRRDSIFPHRRYAGPGTGGHPSVCLGGSSYVITRLARPPDLCRAGVEAGQPGPVGSASQRVMRLKGPDRAPHCSPGPALVQPGMRGMATAVAVWGGSASGQRASLIGSTSDTLTFHLGSLLID